MRNQVRTVVMLGFLWLALIGWLVWIHAQSSVQPPLYDALAYFLKARAFWQDLSRGPLVNPLNLEPSIRPPGTVLLSYPVGFTTDFRGFYFRAIFFPIALVFASVPLSIPKQSALWRASGQIMLAAAFLACAPFFYYFEPTFRTQIGVSFWGLVDGFLIGLAAMAAALTSRSLASQRAWPAVAAIMVGVLMIFVKPSGLALAALDDGVIVGCWIWLAYQNRSDRARLAFMLRRVLLLAIVASVLSGGAFLLALHSRYLGTSNMAYGKASVAILKSESPLDLSALTFLVKMGIGPALALWLIVLLPVSRIGDVAPNRLSLDSSQSARAIAAAAVLLAGTVSWLVFTGGSSQIRYFLPFLFFAIVLVIDHFIAAAARLRPAAKVVVAIVMGIAVTNITLLLAVPHPSDAWQDASGVNVSAGGKPPGVDEAQALVADEGSRGRTVGIYSLDLGLSDADFGSILELAQLDAPASRFIITRPVDWKRPSEFRVSEIANTDYLFFVPIYDAHAKDDPHVIDADLFWKEEYRFRIWASQLSEHEGVKLIAGDEHARLLQVTDRAKLRASLDTMVASYKWTALFLKENQPIWWSLEAVAGRAGESPVRIDDVDFDGIFNLKHADLVRNPDRTITLNTWLDQRTETGPGWVMLVHAVDAGGKILQGFDLPIPDFSARTNPADLQYVTATVTLPPAATHLAVGIYKGNRILVADRGDRDWGDKRVILALPGTP